MTELMTRYEAETGKMAQEKVCDLDDWIETSEYVAWLEHRLLKLESSIRALSRVVSLTDAPITPIKEVTQ